MNNTQIRPIYGVLRPQTHDVCQQRDREAVEGSRAFLELPPVEGRMTPGRKAQVIDAIKAGVITMAEAQARYNLSAEEIATWATRLENHGVAGLRVTRTQRYMGGFYGRR
jgi:hypothetical protein